MSDLACADLLRNTSKPSYYCHAIAKYQQSVEKSIKAMAAAVADAGISEIKIKFNHEVDTYISALLRLPQPKENLDIQNRIRGILNEFHRGEIAALSGLAPRQPASGRLFSRNTEYPFQDVDEIWHVPTEESVFRVEEVKRFAQIASTLVDGASRVVSALQRVRLHP